MAQGAPVNTCDIMIKFKMTKAIAKKIKKRLAEMGLAGESVSYLDCVLFDVALETLGEEQTYYELTDEEWEQQQAERKEAEKRYRVRTIDVTDILKGVL